MTARSSSVITKALTAELRRRFALMDWDGPHGASHWARVRANGLLLAERTGANTRVVELFAFIHDVCRENNWTDHGHGHRSAAYVEDLRAGGIILLSDEETDLLTDACRRHSDGILVADVTVQTCWDADRLDLGRVRIRPDPRYLCTDAARDPQIIAWAYERSRGGTERPEREVDDGDGDSGDGDDLA